jgi:hypothetical protein
MAKIRTIAAIVSPRLQLVVFKPGPKLFEAGTKPPERLQSPGPVPPAEGKKRPIPAGSMVGVGESGGEWCAVTGNGHSGVASREISTIARRYMYEQPCRAGWPMTVEMTRPGLWTRQLWAGE